MGFEIDPVLVFYGFAALTAILIAEAVYLLVFSAKSYRDSVNRRLRALQHDGDRAEVLVQLRRERGLTATGDYRLAIAFLNRLVLQSGVTLGLRRMLALVALLAAGLFVAVLAWRGDPTVAGASAAAGGLLLPFLALRRMRKKRQGRFGAQFPDAIDIIVRSLRAGHPVPVAIAMVAREMPDPVGTEFGMVADEVTYGADLETAMRSLYFRVGQEDLPLFVTAVAIQGSTGGNLSEILGNLSKVIRERFKMRRKIRALSSESRFSALALSSLPFLMFGMLSFMAPDFYGDDVWADPITTPVMAAALGWMAVGNYVMYRMVNFRI